MFFGNGKLFILQHYIQSYLPDNLPLKIKVDVRYTIMIPYHILIVCKTFPRHDISNALLPVIVRLLVVSTKFLFRTANIVLTSHRAAEQAGNAKEPVRDQYQNGGLLYLSSLSSYICSPCCIGRDDLKLKCSANPDLLKANFSENGTRQLGKLTSIKLGHVIELLLAQRIRRNVR